MNIDVQLVRESFQRACQNATAFIDDFYFELGSRVDSIGPMFADVNMELQNRLVRDGISKLIDFSNGSDQAQKELIRLGVRHGPLELNVPEELYDQWTDALMAALKSHDLQFSKSLETTWRKTIRPGIKLMIKHGPKAPLPMD